MLNIFKRLSTKNKFGQDYKSLIQTTNELVGLAIEKDIKSEIDKSPEQSLGIHSYAPIISFLKQFYNKDLPDKKILEIGPGATGIVALSHLKDLGAEAVGMGIGYTPSEKLLRKSGIDYNTMIWECISEEFKENSLDAIYVNYMDPAPYKGRLKFEMSRRGHSIDKIIDVFESFISREMHKVLKPKGIYVLRDWGKDRREYTYADIKNFSQYTMSTYPIESYGDRLYVHIWTEPSQMYENTNSETIRTTYPLNPKEKNMTFGERLIVFQKRA